MALSFAGRVVIFIDFAPRLYDARMPCHFRCLDSFFPCGCAIRPLPCSLSISVTSRGHLRLGSPSIDDDLRWRSYHIRVSMVAMLLFFSSDRMGEQRHWIGLGESEYEIWNKDSRHCQCLLNKAMSMACRLKFALSNQAMNFFLGGRQLLHPRGSALGHVSGCAWPQPHPTLDCQPFFDSMYRNAGKSLS